MATTTLRLDYRRPYDFGLVLDFLRFRALAGVEQVDADSYRRRVLWDGAAASFQVHDDAAASALVLTLDAPALQGKAKARGAFDAFAARVRKMFDLDADPRRINAVLRRDPRLAPLVKRHPGLRVPKAWCNFEMLVRAVLGQQVSVRAATTLASRLVERYGEPFPSAHTLAHAKLENLGVPGKRAQTIGALARAVESGELCLDAGPTYAAFVQDLQRIPGIGPWTAEYAALRCLGEPDAFPASDLVLRQALSTPDKLCSVRAIERIAEAWRPWRGYAAVHLWRNSWKQPTITP